MLGRVLSVGIVAFWLVMMSLLIRSELLGTKPLTYDVPIETVMQKMFESGASSDLLIQHQGSEVGTCSLQIVKERGTPTASYRVHTDLNLNLQVWGRSLRLSSSTDSFFDHRYRLTRFMSHTATGDSKIEASGDVASKEIQLSFNVGGVQEKHKLPFSLLENMGPSGAMGLFGMGGLQLPPEGSGAFAKSALNALAPNNRGPVTTVQETHLMFGKEPVSTWMVHTQYDESLWSKVYVERSGEIQRVETSFGVTMVNAQLGLAAKN